MKIQNNHLKNGVVKIGFLLILLVISSYRSKDYEKDISTSHEDVKADQFTFHPGPLVANVALRRIVLRMDVIR